MKLLPSFLMCLLCGLLTTSLYAAPPSTAEEQLQHDWEKIAKAGDELDPRALIGFILEAVAHDWHPEHVDAALGQLEELQDRDPTSKTYGNFRWYKFQPKPNDQNAVEFTMQKAILVWNQYRDKLSPASRDRLAALIKLSVEGIDRHKIPVDYTNIFLMKTWNYIAIGEAFHLEDVAAKGYAMLREWMDEANQHCVHEFLSPTYAGVQLDSLALLSNYAARAEDKALADRALQLIYWQCQANWFAPDERLGGSHSRDYDYLLGRGLLDQHVTDWGWATTYKPPVLHTFVDCTRWKPADPQAYSSLMSLPRFVWQRWGPLPDQCATQYVGSTISIGVDGSCYGPEDKAFAINFDGGPHIVIGHFFMDGRGDPYGQNPVKLADGHTKAHHLVPFVVSAQNGPSILFFSACPPPEKPPKETVTCLYSHLDLPKEVAVWQGDQLVSLASGKSVDLITAPIFLRYKNTVVGFHFEATDETGKPVLPTYFRDGDGLNACRISWTHTTSAPKGEAHLLFWTKVAENLDDAGFAKFRADFAKTNVTAQFADGKLSARVDSESLAITADLATGSKTTSTTSYPGILTVNGKELGQAILAGSPVN